MRPTPAPSLLSTRCGSPSLRSRPCVPGRHVRRRTAERLFGSGCRTARRCCSVPRCSHHVCEAAPSVRYAITPPTGSSTDSTPTPGPRIVFGPLPEGRTHHKQRVLRHRHLFYACSTPTGSVSRRRSHSGLRSLPHVLTSQRKASRGGGRGARVARAQAHGRAHNAASCGTISRAGAAVVTTMHASLRASHRSARLSSARCRFKLREQPITLVWHALRS